MTEQDRLYGTKSGDSGPPSDEERIARHFRERILDRVSGDVDDRVKRDFPSDRFFAGALAPRSEDQLDDPDDDLQSKMEPNAIGSTVKVRGGSQQDELVVEVSGSVWVRVNPTYEEMQNRDSFISLGDRDESEDVETDLLPVFERFELDGPPIRLRYDEIAGSSRETPAIVRERAQDALSTAFEEIREQAAQRDDIYRDPGEGHPDDDVTGSALRDEGAFTDYLDQREGTPAIPNWDAALDVTATVDRESDRDDQFGIAGVPSRWSR
jgi:hypothetical protein